MNPSSNQNDRLQELLIRWHDNELGAAETEELIQTLHESKAARKNLVHHAVMDAGLSRSLRNTGIRQRNVMVWKRWTIPLAAAAALVLGVYGVNAWQAAQAERGVRGRVTGVEGTVGRIQNSGFRTCGEQRRTIQNGEKDTGTQLRVGDIINIGEGVRVGADGNVKLAYADGSEIEVQKNTTMALGDRRQEPGAKEWFGWAKRHAAKQIRLEAGKLVAQVAKQPAGQPMVLTTPHAKVTVVGTKFILSAQATETRVEVVEGQVQVCALPEPRTVNVAAGQMVRIGPGIEPEVKQARVIDGLLALYLFNEGRGNVIRDVSGVGPPADLVIGCTNMAEWVEGGLRVKGAARIGMAGPADKIDQAIQPNGVFSVEVWRKSDPANQAAKPVARIELKLGEICLGDSRGGNDFGHARHVVYVFAANPNRTLKSSCYENGSAQKNDDVFAPFSELLNKGHMAPEISPAIPERAMLENVPAFPFKGQYCLVAVYGKALRPEEVRRNYEAGPPF
jgi:hypothetical protein